MVKVSDKDELNMYTEQADACGALQEQLRQ